MFKKIKDSVKNFVQKVKTDVKNRIWKIATTVKNHVIKNVWHYAYGTLAVVIGILIVVSSINHAYASGLVDGQKDAYVYMWDTLYDADIDLFNKVLAVADAAALKA
jgi:hypothetical protein